MLKAISADVGHKFKRIASEISEYTIHAYKSFLKI
jgi:hypothetical protein